MFWNTLKRFAALIPYCYELFSHLHHSLIFASNSGAYLSGAS
jgi:hypothetical protein